MAIDIPDINIPTILGNYIDVDEYIDNELKRIFNDTLYNPFALDNNHIVNSSLPEDVLLKISELCSSAIEKQKDASDEVIKSIIDRIDKKIQPISILEGPKIWDNIPPINRSPNDISLFKPNKDYERVAIWGCTYFILCLKTRDTNIFKDQIREKCINNDENTILIDTLIFEAENCLTQLIDEEKSYFEFVKLEEAKNEKMFNQVRKAVQNGYNPYHPEIRPFQAPVATIVDSTVQSKNKNIESPQPNSIQSTLPSLEKYETERKQTNYEIFTKEVSQYRFDELDKVKCLKEEQVCHLIKLIVENPVDYSVPMLKHIGYYDKLRNEYNMSNSKIFKHWSKALSKTERSVKGNWNVLNPNSSDDRYRYKAYDNEEKVASDYKNLLSQHTDNQ